MLRLSSAALALAFLAGGVTACGTTGEEGTPDSGVVTDASAPSDAGIGHDATSHAEGCAAPTGAGTLHQGAINADETWTASASPHIVEFDVRVRAGQLTIEPCAVVRLREGYTITISGDTETATLSAHGEAIANGDGTTTVRPVTFMPDSPGSFWGSLLVHPSGKLDLEHVELRGGGAHATAPNLGGTIVSQGAGEPELTRNVRVVSVLIEDSEGFGVNLQGSAAFTADSTDLTIRGSGQSPSWTNYDTRYPLFIVPPALQTIPDGTYTGNGIDAVFVSNAGGITADETLRNVGVPYRVGGTFAIGPTRTAADGGLVTLTIEPGVTIQMEPGMAVKLGGSSGSIPENIWPVQLVAAGTADLPIVFTSVSTRAVAGDWAGILWHGGAATGNIMSHVRIEYAGASSGDFGFGCGPTANNGGLIFTNWRPADDFIDNLTIADSAAGGIVCGWSSDQDGPNFKTGNTFTNIANGCDVSRWANVSSPACPGNDNIPDCL